MPSAKPRPRTTIAALVICAASVVGIEGCASDASAHPTPASGAAIRAFLADAQRAFAGSFALTYEVTVSYGRGVTRRIEVSVAQRSTDLFSYRMTPSLQLSSPRGHPENYSYEVFTRRLANRHPGAGIYSCSKRLASSRWICHGPYTGIGMGQTQELIGAYPPHALGLGLGNAVETYTGQPAPPAIRPDPAFITNRRVSHQVLRCLSFGRTPHRVGSVCLRPNGLIALYNVSETATFGAWESAILRDYSPHVDSRALDLPSRPIGFR